jgi:UDP-N-acetylglucosamine:LPS N-acetylglucosamine transferase
MNSRFLESIDAASVLSDKIISEEMIYNKIVSLFSNSDILNKYRENIRKITKSDPSDTISDNILELSGGLN